MTDQNGVRTELLPCPFCGGHANVVEDAPMFPDQIWYGVGCANPNCTAYTGYGMRLFDTKAEAIAAWNMRADGPQPTHHVEAVDYLCDTCSNGCDERRVIHVGQGAYDVCERWKEPDYD